MAIEKSPALRCAALLESAAGAWASFPPGPNNRQWGEADLNGQNIWDYYYCMPLPRDLNFITHNCVQSQDYN